MGMLDKSQSILPSHRNNNKLLDFEVIWALVIDIFSGGWLKLWKELFYYILFRTFRLLSRV